MNVSNDLSACLGRFHEFTTIFDVLRQSIAEAKLRSVGLSDREGAELAPAFSVSAADETSFTVKFFGRTFELRLIVNIARNDRGFLECDERAIVECRERVRKQDGDGFHLLEARRLKMDAMGTFTVSRQGSPFGWVPHRQFEQITLLLCGFSIEGFAIPDDTE